MSPRDQNELLHRMLAVEVGAIGFTPIETLRFVQPLNDALAFLSFPCRIDARGGAFFCCIVGLRFECLEPTLGREEPPTTPLAVVPLHLMRDKPVYTEWRFDDEHSLRDVVPIVRSDVDHLAMPFLRTYSHLSAFGQAVSSASPSQWQRVGLDDESRTCVVAVLKVIAGDIPGAIGALDDALAGLADARPGRRVSFERLRRRIVRLSGSSTPRE